jgi:uncharacterized protein involved in exopolysaccharide biosynthesis
MEDSSSEEASRSQPGSQRDQKLVYLAPNSLVVQGQGSELDLFEVWSTIWQGRWIVAAVVATAIAIAVTYIAITEPQYRAEVVLSPSEPRTLQGGLGGTLGQLSGLAGLAGISVGGQSTSESLAVLKSREFTRSFIEREGLMSVLFADKWDDSENSWKVSDPDKQPDIRDGVRLFDLSVRSITEDKKTGLVTLAIKWRDPHMAASWANALVDQLNERMRDRALKDASANVAYLREQLAAANIIALQQPISRLLETELQKEMLAKGNREFSFRIIDRAEVPRRPVWPRPIRILGFTIIGASMVGVVLALLWRAIRVRRQHS